MGTWNTAINGNDTFLDVYSNFYDLYNQGQYPDYVSKQVIEMFNGEFEDSDTQNNALFALALAQWETKTQNGQILSRVKQIILKDQDLEVWERLGADAGLLSKRKVVLDSFLKKITQIKDKPKRRVRKKFDFKCICLVNIIAPDGLKTFEINEEYTNGKYIQTSSIMQWRTGGGSVLYYSAQGKVISAQWIDSQTLEVVHDRGIDFTMKRDTAYYCGDAVNVIYMPK